MLLIPGLLNDADLWADQLEALGDLAASSVLDITQGERLEEIASDLLRDAPERFALAGFSLGGYVALEIARQAPERIERLALLDTCIKPDSSERAAQRREMNRIALSPGTFHGFGERLLDTYLHPTNRSNAEIVERIRGMTQRLGPEIFVRQNSLERKDGTTILAALKCPVLVICGDSDRLTPLADHLEMVTIAQDAHLVVIHQSGHMTPLEQPGEVTRALRRWM